MNMKLNFIVIFLNLKYVFAEIITETEIPQVSAETDE